MDYSISRRAQGALLTLLLALMGTPLAANMKRLYYSCINGIDFSIYQQGIWDMASFKSLNPYLTVHDLKLFNDHFIPALLTAVPITWISGFSPYSLLAWEWLWYVAAWGALLYFLRPKGPELSWVTVLFVFCKGFLAGLTFPVHPDTWSIACWFGLVWAAREKNLKALVAFAIAASLFKEYFCFAIAGMSLYYLAVRNYRFFAPLFAWSVGYALFCFVARPALFGDIYPYASGATGAGQGFADYLWQRTHEFDYLVAFKLYYPFILPLVWIARHEIRDRHHFAWPALMALGPLLGMHFLTNKIYDQYAPALTALPLGVVMFSGFIAKNAGNLKLMGACTALFMLSSLSVHSKHLQLLATGETKKCSMDGRKVPEREQVIRLLRERVRGDELVYATGGIIPNLYWPGLKVVQMEGLHKKGTHRYDYVVIEKGAHGDIYPVPKEQLPVIEGACRKAAAETLFDGEYYYVAKGTFKETCL